MFDRTKEITLNSRRIGKTVIVRFPTDEELIEHSKRIDIVKRSLGSGRGTETDVRGDEAAASWLMNLIRVSSEELDDAEAEYCLSRVLATDLESCTVDGDQAVVELRVLGQILTHTLRIPALREERAFQKTLPRPMQLPNGVTRQKASLEPYGKFYDLLVASPKSAEGYAEGIDNPIPITHKSAAVNAMIAQMNALEVEEAEENFPNTASTGRPTPRPATSVISS